MRLIDADAFKEYLQKGTEENAGIIPKRLVDAVLDIMEGIMLDIDEQPTIDALPVVRCKDCKHRIKWKKSYGCAFWGYYGDEFADGEMFCSKGERKDDEID